MFCLNKGYIGDRKKIEGKRGGTTPSIDIPEEKVESSEHVKMMYYLIKIGLNKNHDVWIAVNDKGKDYNGESFSDIILNEIPSFTAPATVDIAKYIDVIWFNKGTSNPLRFFEIEHSTSIYSGLLRLNDVKIDFPISKATIVIPKRRVNLVEKQIERRTFRQSELSDVCDYLTYEDLKEWYDAVIVDTKFK